MDPLKEEKRAPEGHSKTITACITVIFLLIAAIFCIIGIGAVHVAELDARIEGLEKVCVSDKVKSVEQREIISGSKPTDLHSLLLTQLQDKLSTVQVQSQVSDSDLQREISAQASELRQEIKAESSKLQLQLGDVREHVSTELNVIDDRIQVLNRTINQYNAVAADVTCPAGYKLNPYRGTCIRYVENALSWFDAKASCENAGEFLTTFDTVESAAWLRHQQLTSTWKGSVWVGGRYLSEKKEFEWFGMDTGRMNLAYWNVGEPEDPKTQPCVIAWASHTYYWGDIPCEHKSYFLCEQQNR